MPIVCGICGSENRSNAKFCIGCAGRLPGFAPSGTVATKPDSIPLSLQPQPAFSAHATEFHASPSGSTVTSFWLHLGLVGLTMIIGFVAWCVYVLHHGTAPWTQFTQPTSSTPELRQAPPVVKAKEPESSVPVQPIALAPAASTASASAPAPAAASVPAPAPASTALAFAPQTHSAPATRSARPEQRATERARRIPRDEGISYEPPYQMPTPQPRTLPDPGPPIAPGPGPQYSWTRPSPRSYDDPGPPVVVGPGPRYDARPEVRAPYSGPSSDSGPPIAIGPGPRYDYSTPAARK